MKIGILTFHKCINYGSYWQALNLAKGLQAKGHHAVLLDHQSGRVRFAELKCALQPVLPTPVPPGDRPLYRQKAEAFFSAFERLPLSKPFPLDDPSQMEAFDMVVVGSDEVWNLAHPWYGNSPVFYGDGIKAPLLCSYAASFGNWDASWGIDAQWAERLRNFDLISVRDSNASEIVLRATGTLPEMVLDPCLQFRPEPMAQSQFAFPKPYIAVYGHNFEPYFINRVKAQARTMGLPLISIGYRNDWADHQWITAGPDDFVNFMEQSAAVATNFFHGCVFALQYHKPFVCATTPYRSIKVNALMETAGAVSHLVTPHSSAQAYSQGLSTPLEDPIHHRIVQLRAQSDTFLNRALDLKQYQYA